MLFQQMKLYSVYAKPDEPDGIEQAIFVAEGFSLAAFILGPFWALYHRIWWLAIVSAAVKTYYIMGLTQWFLQPALLLPIDLGWMLLLGFCAHDWQGGNLKRRGYELVDVVSGSHYVAAQQRFYDRYCETAGSYN